MALGAAGLASLMFGRDVLGVPAPLMRWSLKQEDPPPPTLGERLAREIDVLLADLILKQGPALAKAQMEEAFENLVIEPFNAQLQLAHPKPKKKDVKEANALLQQQKLELGEIARNAPFEIAASGGEGVVKVLKEVAELGFRLEQPTFQHPFVPETSIVVGFPTLSTSQPFSEIFTNFRNNEPLVDPTRIRVAWRAFDMKATSSVDKLEIIVDVTGVNFLNSHFGFQPGQWQSDASVIWTHNQDGVTNTLRVGITGHYHYDDELKIGPWEAAITNSLSWDF